MSRTPSKASQGFLLLLVICLGLLSMGWESPVNNFQGRPISTAVPQEGQVLTYNSSTRTWEPLSFTFESLVAPIDSTTNNVSTGYHGLLPKLSGGASDAFHGDGSYGPVLFENLATPTDNTTNNATSAHHGLLPKLSGDAEDVLHGDGTYKHVAIYSAQNVSYYLEDSPSGVGAYESLLSYPHISEEDIDTVNVSASAGEVLIEGYSTAAPLGRTLIEGGEWTFNTYRCANTTLGSTNLIIRVYTRTSEGTETPILAMTSQIESQDTTATLDVTKAVTGSIVVNPTDYLVVKYSCTTTQETNVSVSLFHNGLLHYSYFGAPLLTKHNGMIGLQGGASNDYYHIPSPVSASGEVRLVFDTNATYAETTGSTTQYQLPMVGSGATGITWGLIGDNNVTANSLTTNSFATAVTNRLSPTPGAASGSFRLVYDTNSAYVATGSSSADYQVPFVNSGHTNIVWGLLTGDNISPSAGIVGTQLANKTLTVTQMSDTLGLTSTHLAANAGIAGTQLANATITDTQVATANKDGAQGTASLRTLSTGSPANLGTTASSGAGTSGSPSTHVHAAPLVGVNDTAGSSTTSLIINNPAGGASISTLSGTSTITLTQTDGMINRIINPEGRISQRNATNIGTPVSGTNYYPSDRWVAINGDATRSVTITSQSVTTGGPTLTACIPTFIRATTSNSGNPAAASITLNQNIEGTYVTDLNWGTEQAQPITLSFWARVNHVGGGSNYVLSGSVMNSGSDRAYVWETTIAANDTWTLCAVTIPGDTSGTWLTTNGVGLRVSFDYGSGANYQTAANSWSAGNYVASSGTHYKMVATAGDTVDITGVQVVKGYSAPPYLSRPHSTEHALCLRYHQSTFNVGTAEGRNAGTVGAFLAIGPTNNKAIYSNWTFSVCMRATPVVTTYSTNANSANWSTATDTPIAVISNTGCKGTTILGTTATTLGIQYSIHASADSEI